MINSKKISQVLFKIAKYGALGLVVLVFFVWLGGNVGVKRTKGEQLSTLEYWVYKTYRAPYNLVKYLQHPELFWARNRRLYLQAPEGKVYRLGEDTLPINKNLLFAYFNYEENAYVVELRHLKTNELKQQWSIGKPRLQKKYKAYKKKVLGSESLCDQYPLFCKERKTAEEVHQKRGMRHPLPLAGGRLLFNLKSPLKNNSEQGYYACLSKDSEIVWLGGKTLHHSMEKDQKGNIWACAFGQDTTLFEAENGKKFDYKGDQIVKIGNNGKLLFAKSIHAIYAANPQVQDHFATNITEYDRYHLNDVEPVKDSSAYWRKGDVFISLRNTNTILLYRPSTNKILWQKSGPWRKQHDIRILNDSVITVFNNGLIRDKRDLGSQGSFLLKGHNNLYFYNFAKDSAYTKPKLTQVFAENNLATPTEGRGKFMPEDSLLYVEATDQGKMLLHDFNKEKSYTLVIPASGASQKVRIPLWCRLLPAD